MFLLVGCFGFCGVVGCVGRLILVSRLLLVCLMVMCVFVVGRWLLNLLSNFWVGRVVSIYLLLGRFWFVGRWFVMVSIFWFLLGRMKVWFMVRFFVCSVVSGGLKFVGVGIGVGCDVVSKLLFGFVNYRDCISGISFVWWCSVCFRFLFVRGSLLL